MATFLYRIGKNAYRHWPRFIAGWLVAMVAVVTIAAAFAQPTNDSFSIPGIPSEDAADLQSELFPGSADAFDQATVNVVVSAPVGSTLEDPKYAAAIDGLLVDLADVPQVPAEPALIGPVEAAQAQRQMFLDGAEQSGGDPEAAAANAAAISPLSEDGRVGLITFAFDAPSIPDVDPAAREGVKDALDTARDAGLVAEANGQGMTAQEPPGGKSELIGIAVALLVLVLTFGSLVGAGLPVLTALFGLGLGLAGITAMTAVTDISSSTPILATMIGLAVGIDYTLFILARYRTELERTDDRAEAIGRAVGTAGSAVVFAGLTVIIALAALAVVRIPFLTAMGLAAAATVFVAVMVALTLLPAILGLLKSKAFGGRVRRRVPARDESGLVLNNGVRWARVLARRPIAFVVLVVIGLGVIALPLQNLQLAFPTDSTAPSDTTQRKASNLISEAFGPGREGPLLVVVDGREIEDPDSRGAQFGAVAEWAASQDGVANAQIVATNIDPTREPGPDNAATGAQVLVTPQTGPADRDTERLLQDLRDGQADIEVETGTETGVTGLTAITTDVSERLADALPVYLAIVIGLAFILLMLVFRSILVPLTATLGFLLSMLATLGATVAVFQDGMFGIVEGQPIVAFMPIFLIGVVFGLAMDYQVFLVTRIREAHVHGMSTREAVVDGFRNSARVVTAAATIMTAVFAAFMLQDDVLIKSIGFALGIAIVFDAFIVRLILIPALLYLLGEKAWWLPAWLDKILPNVDVEGDKLAQVLAAEAAAKADQAEDKRDLVSSGIA